MAKTITGIKAGTTTITATYGGVTSNSVSFTVGKIDASLTFDVNSSPLIYDGTPKTLGTVSYDGDGQVKYYVSTSNSAPSASASGWVNCSDGTDVEATNAGTYYVFLQATEGTNYNAVAVKSGNTTGKQIAKATAPPTFSNTTVYANLNPTDFTTSPQVNCGAFTAATAGHSGGLTYTLGTVKNSGGTTVTTGWSLNTSRVLTVPKSTPGGTYTATVTVTEAATSNYNSGTATATITIIVNKKDQVAPTATGDTKPYATSGTISGSASGGGCTGNTINYKSDTNGGTSYGTATTTAPTRNRNSVGTTSFIAFWPGNNYWNASSNSSQAKLIIGKATLSVTEVNYSGVYDGLSHSSSIMVTSANWDGKTIVSGTSTSYGTTVTSTGAVNSEYNLKTATNYTALTTIYYKITGGTNYNDYTDKVTFEISKASGSVSTAPTNAAVTYGSGSNLCSAGSGTGTMQYKLDSGSWSSTIPTATTSVSAGEHTLYYRAAESTNYSQSSEGSITVTVAQKGVTVSWGTITWPYDGSTHSTTCSISSGVISGTTCTVSLSGNSVGAAVGTKTATATLSNDNYTISSGGSSKTLSVTARVVTLSWGELTWVYDGYTHSTTCSVSNLVSGDSCTVTLEGNSVGKNVGTSTVTATSLSNTNYTLTGVASTDKSKTLSITQANGSGSVTMTGWTYGGTVTNPTPASSTNGTSSVTYTWYNSSKTQLSSKPGSTSAVGTYYVKATFAATTNYKAYTTDYVSFTITQKEVGLSWGTASWVYDGNTHSTTCTATGLVSGDTCTVTLTGNSVGKNVGTATVTASSLSNSNYKLPSSKTKSISITQKEVTLTWSTASWTYDGNTHSTSCTAGSLVSGDTCTVTLTGNSVGPDVGTATVTASSLSNSNYKLPSLKTKLISIIQREVTLTWGTTSWPFNGSAHSTTCTAGNLVSGDTCTVTLTGNSITNVGSTTVTASKLSNDNYKLPSANTKTLTVTEGSLTVTATPYNATYDGSSHNGITAISAKNQAGTAVSPTFTYCATESGTYTSTIPTVKNVTTGTKIYYKATLTGYTTVTGYATAVVTAKTATLTFGNLTHTYDASSHTATCSVSNLVSGDTCTVTLSNASRTDQGTQTVTATALSNSNYALPTATASKTATLTINKRPINVTASSASRAYNGSELTSNSATAEAYDSTNNRGLVSGHSMTSYKVTGTITNVGSVDNVVSDAVIKSGNTDVTDNYNINYVKGTLTVTVGTLTVTATPYIDTYDGTAHNGITEISAKNQENTAVSPSYTYSTDGTNYSTTMPTVTNYTAGTTIYWKATLTGYTTETGSVTAKVNKKACTVTGKNSSKAYDGTALTLASASVANKATLSGQVSGHTLSAVTCSGSITYVGTENNTPSAATIKNGSTDVTSNYSITYTPGTLTITQATPTITVIGVDKKYNNTDYYATVTKSDAKGTLYWKFGSAPTTSSYGGTKDISSVGTPVGNPSALSTPINITSVKNVTNQTLYWIFVPSSSATITTGHTYAENFNNSASGSVAMKITAAAITIPTISAVEVTYDGAAHSLTFPAVTGAEITKYQTSTNGSSWTDASPATTNPSLTNADTLYVRAYYTADSNHSGSGYTTGKTIKINQRPINITAGSASRAYNGSALTKSDGTTAEATGTNRGLVSDHSLTSYTNTGSITYVGTANNVPSAAVIKSGTTDVTTNYAITYVNGTLTVTKATPVVSITGVTEDYTGGQFWATATVNAKGTLYWKKGSAPTTSSNDGSVTISSINTATNITSVKDNSDDFEMYWLFVPSSTANSLSSGHTYAENFTNAGGTSSDHKPLTINPRSISNVTASAAAVTYNGSQQTATISISDSGGNLTSNDYTISGNTGTNATNYTITITGRNNYTGTKTITWTINKRPVTITADSASKTYDGTALTKNSVTASTQNDTNNTGMISSHHIHSWTVSGTQTIAGSSNNTVTAATIYTGASSTHGGSGDTNNVTSNYNITFAKGTLTVNTRAVTATATDQTKVYNGSKLTATNTGTVTNLPSNHTITYSCTGEIGPGVSSGTKTLSSVVIKNSGGTDVTSSFTVTKKNGTLSITAADITYTNTSPVSEYCTATAVAATKTLGSVSISIASESAIDYSGTAITSGSNPSVEGYTISQSGWSISSDGKTITVPANVAAGTYNITVTAAKPNHTSKANGISVQLVSVTLNNIELTLEKTTIPYGGSTKVASVTATYNNGATKDVKDDTNTSYSTNPTGIVTIS